MEINQVLLVHDDSRPHTCVLTGDAMALMGWTVLSHHSYSPNLTPSDFHLFGPLKDSLQGHCFADKDDQKHCA